MNKRTTMGLRQRFVRLAAVAVALPMLALAAPATAQELAPEHVALGRKYVELTDRAGIYEVALIETAIESQRTILRQNPDLREPVDDAISTTLQHYAARKGELLDQFGRLYALRFTIEELQAIVDFYETPVGAKLAEVNSTISSDIAAVMQVFQNNLRTEFFARVRSELRTAGHEF
ncbi:DUF2059 domain-containing protein [Arsenicitalea aurantiaca]|nr:DUF2059 domain-containing protein [Arsenicitalea aurantiaca]